MLKVDTRHSSFNIWVFFSLFQWIFILIKISRSHCKRGYGSRLVSFTTADAFTPLWITNQTCLYASMVSEGLLQIYNLKELLKDHSVDPTTISVDVRMTILKSINFEALKKSVVIFKEMLGKQTIRVGFRSALSLISAIIRSVLSSRL